MISKKMAAYIINLASQTGADFVEIFNEDTLKKNIALEEDKVDDIITTNTYGVGLRLLKGLQSVYGYTSDLSKKGLSELAYNLSASFNGKKVLPDVVTFKNQKYKKVNKPIKSVLEVPTNEIIDLLRVGIDEMKVYDKRIVRNMAYFLIDIKDITIFNSDGKIFTKHNEYGRYILNCVASDQGKMQSAFTGPGSQGGWDFFTKTLNVKELAHDTAVKCIKMLEARECPSGHFPVVIGKGWGGVIFHEACGHQLEATSVAKGLSVFSGMKVKQIANTVVSAYDNGTMPNEWGSNDIDDEGISTHNNCLIKDGILVGYLVDKFNARRMNEEPNGCSRRQSYKFEPTSRMSNTYIAPGKSSLEDLISNTKLGIYAVSFGGGSVNPATGDFNFGCDEAYIIKDGKIGEPVRGATLVGNAKEILKHIDMVANELALGQGECGSASGNIHVNVGQPAIRVDDITVGGQGGNINEF